MPTSLASTFVNSISNFTAGNQGIVDELTNVINLDSMTVGAQQTNGVASYFVQLMFDYYAELRRSFRGIVENVQQNTLSFNNRLEITSRLDPLTSQIITLKIEDIVDTLLGLTSVLGELFQEVSTICTGMQTHITRISEEIHRIQASHI